MKKKLRKIKFDEIRLERYRWLNWCNFKVIFVRDKIWISEWNLLQIVDIRTTFWTIPRSAKLVFTTAQNWKEAAWRIDETYIVISLQGILRALNSLSNDTWVISIRLLNQNLWSFYWSAVKKKKNNLTSFRLTEYTFGFWTIK